MPQLGTAYHLAMSELGQLRQFRDVRVTSVLPPKADIHRKVRHVSNVPGPAFKPLWREPMPDALSGQ
jgi:hypothetical protein